MCVCVCACVRVCVRVCVCVCVCVCPGCVFCSLGNEASLKHPLLPTMHLKTSMKQALLAPRPCQTGFYLLEPQPVKYVPEYAKLFLLAAETP